MQTLQHQVGAWADATFPHATLSSILEHLKEEVNDELHPEAAPGEAADVLLLLLHYAHRRNFDLLSEAQRKLEINQTRQWAPPDARGVSRHV